MKTVVLLPFHFFYRIQATISYVQRYFFFDMNLQGNELKKGKSIFLMNAPEIFVAPPSIPIIVCFSLKTGWTLDLEYGGKILQFV